MKTRLELNSPDFKSIHGQKSGGFVIGLGRKSEESSASPSLAMSEQETHDKMLEKLDILSDSSNRPSTPSSSEES